MIKLEKITSTCVLLITLYATQVYSQTYGGKDEFLMPPLSGSYSVGTVSFRLENMLVKNLSETQRICVKIWYPSDSVVHWSNYNNYLEGYDLDEIVSLFKKMDVKTEEIEKLSSYKTRSTKNIGISLREKSYPVIVFTPGYYFGFNDIYSCFIETLASHGYIVVAPSHVHDQICIIGNEGEDNSLNSKIAALPYLQMWWLDKTNFRSYEKKENQPVLSEYYLKGLTRFKKKLAQWESNTLYVIDYLKSENNQLPAGLVARMDLSQIGAMGQSFGGALSNHMCVTNDQIAAAVNLDGYQFGQVSYSSSSKPLMLIEGDQQLRWRIGNEYIYRNCDNLQYARIKGSLHFIFSDLPFFNKFIDEERVQRLTGITEGQKAISWMNYLILSFFNQHLQGQESNLADKLIDNESYLYQISNKCIYLK